MPCHIQYDINIGCIHDEYTGMGAAPQVGQVVAWQAYVAYERSNPQRLETDSPVLHARISLAFSQALNYMWSFPEV